MLVSTADLLIASVSPCRRLDPCRERHSKAGGLALLGVPLCPSCIKTGVRFGLPEPDSVSHCRIPEFASTHSHALDFQQFAQHFQLAGNVPHAHGAMVGRTVPIPLVEEFSCSNRKTVSAIGIADFENWPGHRFSFSHQQLQVAV